MEILWGVFDAGDSPITGGAASTSVKIRRSSDGFMLDWTDLVFKASGWATLSTTLSEVSAANLPGYYKKDVTESAWNDGFYQIIVSYSGSPKNVGDIEVYTLGGKIVDTVQTGDSFARLGVAGVGLTNLGDTRIANLNATVSSRALETTAQSILTESSSHPTLSEIEATSILAKEATSAAIKAKTDTIVWANITDIKDMSLGKWSIDKVTKVLTMYKADGVTVLKQFNLVDTSLISERNPI